MNDQTQPTSIPPTGAASALTDVLERCECGRGDMVTLPNGERCCSDTLRKFEMQNGRPYGVR